MTALLERLAANETPQTRLRSGLLRPEEEIEPERSPAGVLKYLMEERG
jgi:hypothetical protein